MRCFTPSKRRCAAFVKGASRLRSGTLPVIEGLESAWHTGDGARARCTAESPGPAIVEPLERRVHLTTTFAASMSALQTSDSLTVSVNLYTTGDYANKWEVRYGDMLPAPTAPTVTTSTSSGSVPLGNYYVRITYVNAYGETNASGESSASLNGTGHITVTSPAASGNATGYNVYIGSSNGERKQNGSTPVAIGTNYTQSTALSTTTPVYPTTNSAAASTTYTPSGSYFTGPTSTAPGMDDGAEPLLAWSPGWRSIL